MTVRKSVTIGLLVPAISKASETVVAEQLTDHFDKKNVLNLMQFGFRKNHSTETACCYFIKASLDKGGGGVVGAVFLDLRKAFDTVNHSVLLSKLSIFKLSANVLKWLQSYLANRFQSVRIKDKISPLRSCNMGVPQGSILGPLLFSTYINDLPTVCDDVETLRYADDTVIFTHGKDADVVAAKRSATLEKVTEWLNLSCLTLNTEKTVARLFSKHRNQNVHPNVYVAGQAIKNVDEFKYLAVILDSSLTFKKHIKNMSYFKI